jgi:Tol biopolymer transport system component
MQPGEIVGHYRIVEPLGQGGMGEVFVAEDTRLNRRVALKVLPQIFAADPVYRQRFEREAQAVAALNHPNIVTIHSVEEHDGRLLLTMELVDGRPLGELIPKGGLPLDRILRIGMEVADALAAAQARGITHRDVKPGNVIVTPQGRAKVLDFGLAKLREAETGRAPADVTRMSASSTITGEGKIVGTVAYMSPEQAEGKPVDPRSDIFSLGVVLHEMATGQRPFRGDTNVSVISAIIKDTPTPITESNPNLPADLARIVRRCLAKDPERRYQTAQDLRNELEELKQDTASGTVAIVRPKPARRLPVIAILGAVAAVAAVVAVVVLVMVMGSKTSKPDAGAGTFTLDRLARLTSTGTASLAAMSPDGRYVVHVKGEPGGLGLWTRQTATTSDVRIVAPSDSRFDGIAFAPDGNYVYYTAYPGVGGVAGLYRVPVLGGTSVKLIDDVDSPVTFSPDQKRMAFMRGSMVRGTTELMVADADGANARTLAMATAPDKFQSEGPSWSPDGKTILATAVSTRPGVPAVVYAVDATTGAARAIGEGWGHLRDVQWLPDGRSFVVTGIDFSGLATPQIWRVAYPSGERTRVTNDLNSYIGASLAADGRSLATVQTETVAGIYIAEGADKEPRKVTGGAGRADGNTGLAWIPDGRIVYSSNASGFPQLWISDADGANTRQLTSTVGPSTGPSASADGKWIYFTSYAKEGSCLFRIAPDGAGLQQLTSDGDARTGILSPDGKTLYYTAIRSGLPRLMKMAADGGPAEQAFDGQYRGFQISADGTRMVGLAWSEEQRRSVLAILSLADRRLEPLTGGLGITLFMPDGGFAVVQRVQGRSVITVRSASGGTPRPVTPPHPDFVYSGAVSRDGRIAFSRGSSTSDVVLIKAK